MPLNEPKPEADAPAPQRVVTGKSHTRHHSLMSATDQWMAEHPFHPRLVPYFLYLLFLGVIPLARDWQPATYPALYAVQCLIVATLLWRYRALTPELNLRFHWLAIPVGVGVFAAWLALGDASRLFLSRSATPEPHFFQRAQPAIAHTSLALRVVGMSIIVPLMEELFVRSMMLRCLHSARRTWLGIVQLAQELPIIGERIIQSSLGDRIAHEPPAFRSQFESTAPGHVSVFGAIASTLVFMAAHDPADYLGCIVCGLAYSALVAATNRTGAAKQKGLGPAVWAHGITNLLIWVYSVRTGDYRFM